jgi:hypothetical protein
MAKEQRNIFQSKGLQVFSQILDFGLKVNLLATLHTTILFFSKVFIAATGESSAE